MILNNIYYKYTHLNLTLGKIYRHFTGKDIKEYGLFRNHWWQKFKRKRDN